VDEPHAARPRVDFDADVAEKISTSDGDETFTGWYCVATEDFPCPAGGCDFVARHMTAAHRIIVWPSIDDRMMFTYARDAQKFGRNPRIVEYTPERGPCIAYDRWVQIGKPIHGALPDPSGYYDDWKAL
jgi:hypothetical protein